MSGVVGISSVFVGVWVIGVFSVFSVFSVFWSVRGFVVVLGADACASATSPAAAR
jgi:hypothetical protein